MARFAEAKETFLRRSLKLEHGLPSHDTFSRLFRQLDPTQFSATFQHFMARFAGAVRGVVAIDGKVPHLASLPNIDGVERPLFLAFNNGGLR